jgi:DNA-binding NtrC family response regulator
MTAGRVLVVDDESSITGALELILSDRGHEVRAANSIGEADELLKGVPFDLVFTDLRLPDGTGVELLMRIKEDTPETEVVLMTAHGSLDLTIEAIKKGAYYYVEKPFNADQVLMLAERALESASFKRENSVLRQVLSKDSEAFGLVGRSAKMTHIYEIIRATADSEASVLIEGESGTGKELIARAMHLQSRRSGRPFICINCAAVPSDLMESEMFGHRKGSFTGADRDKRGLIEAANGGTLFLDEIAEMPMVLQSKLLRVLQQRQLRRVGDEQEIDVDFRLVSATNRDTLEAVRQGSLRTDLYYRISTIKIKVPALRERLEDLPLLVTRFLRQYSDKYRKKISAISSDAMRLLSAYSFPGNVRELESAIERAVLFSRGDLIRPADLPEQFREPSGAPAPDMELPSMTLEELEREAIRQTLERTGGNIKKTAEILNLHRPTLYRKLKSFGLAK